MKSQCAVICLCFNPGPRPCLYDDDEEWKHLPRQDVLTNRNSSVPGIYEKRKDVFGDKQWFCQVNFNNKLGFR